MGIRSGLCQVSASYLSISRYFFLALAVVGLLGSVTGVFAQSQVQQQQLTLTLSHVKVFSGPAYQFSITSATGTVTVQGPWSGGPIHFGGWIAVTDDRGVINGTISSNDFSPSPLSYPSSASSNFSYVGSGTTEMPASSSYNHTSQVGKVHAVLGD